MFYGVQWRRRMRLLSRKSTGFTLVEMLIVIALIGILAAALVEKMDAALAQARDTRRKADMRKVQSALSTYLARYGNFPATSPGSYYGSSPLDGHITNGGNWIPGLAPTFIPRLPSDPQEGAMGNADLLAACGSAHKIYLYMSDGQNYKLMNQCGMEVAPLLSTDPFYDPKRPPNTWMVCSGEPACTQW
jgi:prepilin-type N-terminal cleavage/methylation domain-containing protein